MARMPQCLPPGATQQGFLRQKQHGNQCLLNLSDHNLLEIHYTNIMFVYNCVYTHIFLSQLGNILPPLGPLPKKLLGSLPHYPSILGQSLPRLSDSQVKTPTWMFRAPPKPRRPGAQATPLSSATQRAGRRDGIGAQTSGLLHQACP